MKKQAMDIAQWQKRLEENFSVNGVVAGQLLEVIDLENASGEFFVSSFHGQSVLIDSFQSFYIETIHSAYDWIAKNGWPKECVNYAPILLYYVTIFRSFRACENLLIKGYPLHGYSLLRNLKDQAVFLGGIANNITTFPKLHGYPENTKPITIEEWKKQKESANVITDREWKNKIKEIKKEEYRVFGRMLRKKSGLPKEIIEELEKWEQLFHMEVHGSRLTFFGELGEWLRSGNPPSLGPKPIKTSWAMYMNRAVEIGWMLVRLLPYIQPSENAFGEKWKERQKILDDSFRFAEQDLSELGKKIADAFIFFIDEKFQFPENFYYFEADGTA